MRRKTFLVVISFALLLQAFTVSANTPISKDYSLHTLYIFNFVKYTEWPGANKTIIIGVVNSTEATEALLKLVKTKSSAAGITYTIKNTKDEAELKECQIVFIPSNSSHLAPKLITALAAQPILVITEDPDFTKSGASISFKIVSEKIRFQLNEETFKTKGLKVSGTLVSLSDKQ
jgi:hypothetical protein